MLHIGSGYMSEDFSFKFSMFEFFKIKSSTKIKKYYKIIWLYDYVEEKAILNKVSQNTSKYYIQETSNQQSN